MKIKFNWGIGIAIVYGAFVFILLANVLFSTLQRTDLVEDDYYEHELNYQQKINSLERTNRLAEKVEFIQGGGTLTLKFPDLFKEHEVIGIFHFYKPSNASYDKKIKIELNADGLQTIDTRNFPKGFWRVKIDWMWADSSYYVEKEINL